MNIQKVKIENFKGIESLGLELGGRSVYVVGGNAMGKTSFISAIFCALTGKDMPPSPITGAKRSGKIEIELDGYAVEIEFKKKGKKIEKKLSLWSTDDGEKLDAPRARLDAIIGNLEFNPFEFMRMTPKPQLDYFCKVFGIKGVFEIDDDYRELNEVISFDKKSLLNLKSQSEPYDLKAIVDPIDVSKAVQEYADAVDKNAQIDSFGQKVISATKHHFNKLQEIVDLKNEAIELKKKISAGKTWLENHPKTDVSALKATIDNSETINTDIKFATTQRDLDLKIEETESAIEESQDEKKVLIVKKKALISKHTKEIKGFDYDNELGFTLDGLPFHIDQNNTAAQIVVGLKLGAGLLGDVKIARFEGSLLDQENLDAVNDFATKEGLQLFVELVDRNEKELRFEFIEESEPVKK